MLSQQIEDLHNQLDELELILGAAEILECHLCPQTIGYIKETKENADTAKCIVETMIKNTVAKNPAATPVQWNALLEHLIKLVKDTYTCVDVKHCHEVQTL